MAMNDPLGDMLTRIRNAQMRRRPKVSSPASNLRTRVLDVLAEEGYIRGYTRVDHKNGMSELEIELKYLNGQPAIKEIARVSKPGRRVYSPLRDLPTVANGLGLSITPILTADIINLLAAPERPGLGRLWVDGALLLVVLLQNIPTQYLYIRLLSQAIRRVETLLRIALGHHLQHVSIGFYTRQSSGVLQTKVLRDVEDRKACAAELVQRTLDNGAPDNVTVIVADVVEA